MAKVLVIRKPDRTIHQAQLKTKATLMAYNNRLPEGKKWTFEEMEQEEADKLPFIDPDFVSPLDAKAKLSEKDAQIAELMAKLDALSNGSSEGNQDTTLPPQLTPALTAEAVILKINAAESEDEVKALILLDTRKTVIDAANKKIASFSK